MSRRTWKRRELVWLLLGLALGVILLSLTVDPDPKGKSAWYERAFLGAISPFQRAATTIRDKTYKVISHYIYLVHTAEENEVLKGENFRLKGELLSHQRCTDENNRLRSAVDFKEGSKWEMVAARVIGHNVQAEFRLLTIDKGSDAGLKKRMPVVSTDGLVGQIYRVGSESSQVLMITDPTSVVDGRIEKSGARGLVRGRVAGAELDRTHYISSLEFIDKAEIVSEGDVVITSGLDSLFPAGIPVGIVKKVKVNPHGIFKSARILPKADLMGLAEVLIISNWHP